MTLKVVPLYESNSRDPLAMARRLADDIEAGVYGDVDAVTAVVVTKNGAVEVFGWGSTDQFRSIAHLHLALAKMTALGNSDA